MSMRRSTRAIVPVAVVAIILVGSNCRNAPEERPAGPGDAPSVQERAAAETPSGAGAGTGGATPAASRDAAGSTGSIPVNSQKDAGTPGTTAQKPEATAPASGAQCKSDADCTISRFIPGECCQDCEERAATREAYDAQESQCAEKLARCPQRACAPPRMRRSAACVSGTCQVTTSVDD